MQKTRDPAVQFLVVDVPVIMQQFSERRAHAATSREVPQKSSSTSSGRFWGAIVAAFCGICRTPSTRTLSADFSGAHRRPTVVGGHGGSLTPRCPATYTISPRDCVATHCGVTIHIVLLSTCPKQQQWFNLRRLRFNRRGTSTPLKGVESCSLPSGWPNPIPAIPPYVVTTPHLHGAPTTEETSYPNAKARSGINMEKRTKINTFFKKKKKGKLWIMEKKKRMNKKIEKKKQEKRPQRCGGK